MCKYRTICNSLDQDLKNAAEKIKLQQKQEQQRLEAMEELKRQEKQKKEEHDRIADLAQYSNLNNPQMI